MMNILGDPQRQLNIANAVYIAAAALALIATFFVVILGNRVGSLKDEQLRAYQKEADVHIAEANRRAAEANEKAEQERLARVLIEQRLSGRRVSKETHDKMVKILKPTPGLIIVGGLYNIEESRAFAIDIQAVFQDAGWTAVLDLTGSSLRPPVGVSCKADTSKPAGVALKVAMRLLPGSQVVDTRYTDNKDAVGSIAVGIRTPP